MANPLRIPSADDFPYGWRWLGRTAILFITTRNRCRTSRTERKRVAVLDATVQILREQQSKCRERGLSHMERVHNVSLYLLLVDRDLSFWKLEMVSTFDLPRLRFAARQVALLLYEACDDLSELLGKKFRQSLPALGISETEIREFNVVSKRLNSFKESNRKFLYNDIRNVAAGHRAQDSLEFLRKVEAIDPIQVFELGAEFFDIIRPLSDFLVKTTQRAGQPLNAFRQLLGSPKFMASLKTQQVNETTVDERSPAD